MSEVEQRDTETSEEKPGAPLEDLEPDEGETEAVRGGKAPAPGGPVPIPYPNLN
jgi:hypothetical protein